MAAKLYQAASFARSLQKSVQRSQPPARHTVHRIRAMSTQADTIRETVTNNKVVVYSKTYCPYCSRVKDLLYKLKANPLVLELDNLADGSEIQSTLTTITSSRTVPQVFIGGKFVGGCDDTYAAYQSGKLKSLFEEAGVAAAL